MPQDGLTKRVIEGVSAGHCRSAAPLVGQFRTISVLGFNDVSAQKASEYDEEASVAAFIAEGNPNASEF